jgi:ribulose-5-phosphate 4-epimerase/fuculose-1-phosphate aldolase
MTLTASPTHAPGSLRERVSPAEWETRVMLAASYRLMAHAGIFDLANNHLSARIPDRPDAYLVKGQSQFFDEVTASSLLAYDFRGAQLYPSDDCVSPGGLVIHGGVMEARPDLMAVFHTHTPANIGVSAQACGLLPISQHAVKFYNRIGYHEFGGFEFDLAGRERLIRDLEGKRTLIMRNHGVLCCGRSIPEAYVSHHFLEMACRAQVAALAAGGTTALVIPSPEVAEHAARQSEKTDRTRDWPALMRLADRIAPTFRD